MAAMSVEIEVTGATFNGADTITCTLAYRLINDANQNVLATKTLTMDIKDTGDVNDPSDALRLQLDAATQWGQWLPAANKVSQFVGRKTRTEIA